MKLILSIACSLLMVSSFAAQQSKLADWQFDNNNLPKVRYLGHYPFISTPAELDIGVTHTGNRSEPYFLLGNYKMVLLTHVSGEYELLTSERSWGRLNQGNEINTGNSGAYFIENDKKTLLTGPNSLATNQNAFQMSSGVGYSEYQYQLPNELAIKRTIKVAPSTEYDNGLGMMLIDVKFTNNGTAARSLNYHEYIRANYEMSYQQRSPKKVDYTSTIKQFSSQLIKADFKAFPRQTLLWKNAKSNAEYEGFPPSLFINTISKNSTVSSYTDPKKHNVLDAITNVELAPGASKTYQFIIGFSFTPMQESIKEQVSELLLLDKQAGSSNNFAKQWLSVLPDFEQEPDQDLRRELVWNAHVIEAMSTYSQYFKETKTPQGSNYDYYWGQHASIRDHLQHMLPMLYYNPKLAKSSLRYALQKVTPNGGIPIVEKGMGYQTNLWYEQSDNQLFLLNALNEYLRVTKDYDFLTEMVSYYPLENSAKDTVIEHIEQMVIFLRDEVNLGPRGLVRLLNSDWNDDLYFVLAEQPYNRMYMNSESLLNTTMLIKVYGDLIGHLEKTNGQLYPRQSSLLNSIKEQRSSIYKSFLKDWGDSDFIRRFYWGSQSVGHDKAYIWPQAFALQIPEISDDRKNKIIDKIDQRLFQEEKVGARLMETTLPTKNKHYAPDGMGENGAFWFSPYGQYVLGVAEVDIDKAWQYFHRSTFKTIANQYPEFWIGQWTAGDSINSSLSTIPGNARHMMYNAHPHAYQLYMYYRLKEISKIKK